MPVEPCCTRVQNGRMNKNHQTETLETDDGMVEAIKEGRDEPWHIAHPWGDERFYGSRPEVKARIKSLVKEAQQSN